MDLIDTATGALSARVLATAGEGALGSFLADGVIAGVGSVVIFLPQILILYAIVAVLEDSGYPRPPGLFDGSALQLDRDEREEFLCLCSPALPVPFPVLWRPVPSRIPRPA